MELFTLQRACIEKQKRKQEDDKSDSMNYSFGKMRSLGQRFASTQIHFWWNTKLDVQLFLRRIAQPTDFKCIDFQWITTISDCGLTLNRNNDSVLFFFFLKFWANHTKWFQMFILCCFFSHYFESHCNHLRIVA